MTWLTILLNLKERRPKTMGEIYKEVHFGDYCKNCMYLDKPDSEDPCHECLGEPVNLYSHKPVRWKEKGEE